MKSKNLKVYSVRLNEQQAKAAVHYGINLALLLRKALHKELLKYGTECEFCGSKIKRKCA